MAFDPYALFAALNQSGYFNRAQQAQAQQAAAANQAGQAQTTQQEQAAQLPEGGSASRAANLNAGAANLAPQGGNPQEPTSQAAPINPLTGLPLGAATVTPEQAQAGQQNSTGANEKGWWDQLKQNLSGYGLEGQELQDWQDNMATSMFLASLGQAIGGDSFGGRLGQGVLNYGQGAIAGQNALQSEQTLFDLLRGSANATSGNPPLTQTTQATVYESPNTSGYGRTKTPSFIEDIVRRSSI